MKAFTLSIVFVFMSAIMTHVSELPGLSFSHSRAEAGITATTLLHIVKGV